jgi:protoheme IX farnesyltransferase
MKAEPQVVSRIEPAARLRLLDYLELTKPKISALAVLAALTGFYMAGEGSLEVLLLIHILTGTALVGAGASALNQTLEHELDALMERTRHRPVPAGRIGWSEGLIFGGCLSAAGTGYLALTGGPLAAAAALAAMMLYVFLYTPLKRMTYLNTMIGAIPGALPPMIGWAASSGELPLRSWILFSILFFWQLPHFYAIAWLYRDDYLKGGFKMISNDDPLGDKIFFRISGQMLALIAASLTPTIWGMTDRIYFFVALMMGAVFMGGAWFMAHSRARASARALLLISVIYLPVLLVAMMLCKIA